ncbi:kinase-like domain-containing protein [Hyaloraphidium curvatum]|nr:kinase-like domain-containing protein [Hyaloraphidium curvatum]
MLPAIPDDASATDCASPEGSPVAGGRPRASSAASSTASADALAEIAAAFAHGRARRRRLRAVRTVGRGSEAKVKAAVDLDTGALVAVKVVARPVPALGPGVDRQDTEHVLLERQRQAKTLRDRFKAIAALSHPSVCRMFEYFETSTKIYTVLELGEGDLHAFLASRGGLLPDYTVRTISERIFSALAYLHSHGIVHRDVKPPNVLLRSFADPSSVFLADFTGSHVASSTFGLRTVIGTPFYLAPELVRGEIYDHRVDSYSAGIVAYELFFGRTPFEDCTDFLQLYARIGRGSFAFPKYPQASPKFLDFVSRLLRNNPRERMPADEALLHPFLAPLPWEDPDDSTGTLVVFDESTGELKCAPGVTC